VFILNKKNLKNPDKIFNNQCKELIYQKIILNKLILLYFKIGKIKEEVIPQTRQPSFLA